jgi:hypothetical protein
MINCLIKEMETNRFPDAFEGLKAPDLDASKHTRAI